MSFGKVKASFSILKTLRRIFITFFLKPAPAPPVSVLKPLRYTACAVNESWANIVSTFITFTFAFTDSPLTTEVKTKSASGQALGERMCRNLIFFASEISNCVPVMSSNSSSAVCTIQTPGVIGSPGK